MTIDLSTPPGFQQPDQDAQFCRLSDDFPGVTYSPATPPTDIQQHHPYDTLANIEDVIGSAHDDVITGNDLDNMVDPGLGDDRSPVTAAATPSPTGRAVAGVTIDLTTQTTDKSDGQGTNYTDTIPASPTLTDPTSTT